MIVAGFGFRASASVQSLIQALEAAGGGNADAIATATDKAAAPVFQNFAGAVQKPVHPVAADQLSAQITQTQSAPSQTHRKTGSMAEASALAAAGPGATLIQRRIISADGRATCALAKGENE